jgi:hypothetical protein
MQELAVCLHTEVSAENKNSTYSPLQKVQINDYGHADFAIIYLQLVLSIFGGPN